MFQGQKVRQLSAAALALVLMSSAVAPAMARPDDRRDGRPGESWHEREQRGGGEWSDNRYANAPSHRGPASEHRRDRDDHRDRHDRDVVVVRPYGHPDAGYRRDRDDGDAYGWLAFTAVAVKLLDVMNERQQRAYYDVPPRIADVRVGETVYWNDAGASGRVTVLRDGTSSTGRYCREFQQTVVIGGRSEDAYGTACLQPDGAWELVPS